MPMSPVSKLRPAARRRPPAQDRSSPSTTSTRKDFPAEVRPLSGNDRRRAHRPADGGQSSCRAGRYGLDQAHWPAAGRAVKVAGVIDLPDADSLFQAVGLPPQAAPQAPPDNVLVLPRDDWQQLFDPQQKTRPDTTRLQLHVRLAHRGAAARPGHGLSPLSRAHRGTSRHGSSGQALVADNLGSRLGAVREDALYASVLFLFLGLPGIALAIALTFARHFVRRGAPAQGASACCASAARRRKRSCPCRPSRPRSAAVGGTALGLAGALLFGRVAPGLHVTAQHEWPDAASCRLVRVADGFRRLPVSRLARRSLD